MYCSVRIYTLSQHLEIKKSLPTAYPFNKVVEPLYRQYIFKYKKSGYNARDTTFRLRFHRGAWINQRADCSTVIYRKKVHRIHVFLCILKPGLLYPDHKIGGKLCLGSQTKRQFPKLLCISHYYWYFGNIFILVGRAERSAKWHKTTHSWYRWSWVSEAILSEAFHFLYLGG